MHRQLFKDKANGNRRLNYCGHSQEIHGRPKKASKKFFFFHQTFTMIYILYIIL